MNSFGKGFKGFVYKSHTTGISMLSRWTFSRFWGLQTSHSAGVEIWYHLMIRYLCQQNIKTSTPGEKVKQVSLLGPQRPKWCHWLSQSCAAKHPQSFVFLWLFKSARNNVYAWFIHVSITGLCLWLTNWINVVQNIRREEYANHAISVFV